MSDRLTGIEVVPAEVTGYISAISVNTGIASTPFIINISGATDRFGNSVSGIISVSITNNDIVNYAINDIVVNNGTGNNSQLIIDAADHSVTFLLVFGTVTNYLSLDKILPANKVGRLELISSVSKITVGHYFNEDVIVRIYDIYNNLKYNSTNYI